VPRVHSYVLLLYILQYYSMILYYTSLTHSVFGFAENSQWTGHVDGCGDGISLKYNIEPVESIPVHLQVYRAVNVPDIIITVPWRRPPLDLPLSVYNIHYTHTYTHIHNVHILSTGWNAYGHKLLQVCMYT